MTTARSLLRSGSAATAAQLVRIVALQVAHMIAGRYVPPEQRGVWSWLEALFLLLASVRDLGVTNHVVRLAPMPFGTFLRVELVAGLALAGAVFGGAPWLAAGFAGGGEDVVAGIRVLAIGIVLEGLGAVALIWFEAKLRIERTLSAEILRTIAYCAVVLWGALHGWGFWSFVAGQLAGQLLFALELWRRARPEIELAAAPGGALRLVADSLPLAGVWWLTTAVAYGDSFVLGGLFGRADVGLFMFGFTYAFLVFRVLQQPIARSLFPALVAFGGRPDEQLRAWRLATVLFLALEVPAALLLAANAELVALVLRGEEYLGAAPYLRAPRLRAARRSARALRRRAARGPRPRSGAASSRSRCSSSRWSPAASCSAAGSTRRSAWPGPTSCPLGAPVILVALLRAGGAAELLRLARELAEIYLVPLAPFALAWWLTPDSRWLRLAATLAAAALALAWTWRRHREEFRDFFAAAPPTVPSPHLEA